MKEAGRAAAEGGWWNGHKSSTEPACLMVPAKETFCLVKFTPKWNVAVPKKSKLNWKQGIRDP